MVRLILTPTSMVACTIRVPFHPIESCELRKIFSKREKFMLQFMRLTHIILCTRLTLNQRATTSHTQIFPSSLHRLRIRLSHTSQFLLSPRISQNLRLSKSCSKNHSKTRSPVLLASEKRSKFSSSLTTLSPLCKVFLMRFHKRIT